MAYVPYPDGRVFWFSTDASIPTGFTRDDNFAERYLKGSSATGGSNGGNGNHLHTTVAHDHSGPGHTHTYTGTSTMTLGSNRKADDDPGTEVFPLYCAPTHGHVAATSYGSNCAWNTASPSTPSHATEIEPASITVIVLQPDDASQEIPDDTCVLGEDASDFDGDWTALSAANNRFMKGATATTGDGGVTAAASAAHNHGGAFTDNHLHSGAGHGHASKVCGAATSTVELVDSSGANASKPSQEHNVTLNSVTEPDAGTTNPTINNSSSPLEPAHVELLVMQNTSGGDKGLSGGEVIGFVGSGALPTDWVLCNGTDSDYDTVDQHIKLVTSGPGDTGGSNTHDHVSPSHTHSTSDHNNHTATESDSFHYKPTGLPVVSTCVNNHNHGWTIGDGGAGTTDGTALTISAVNHEPLYRTIRFIKYVSPEKEITLGCLHGTSGVVLAG